MLKQRALANSAIAVAAALLTVATPARAQDEAALKRYFEGRRIIVRMDMPGAADGVDVRLEPADGIDYKAYRDNLKRYGVALAAGDASVVTQIKVKKDLIEFQIGGGGFGTFGDDTSTSSGITPIDRSERERDLERQIKRETDRDRKRDLRRELDRLRDRRERENRRLRAERERIEADKRERIAEQRIRGGSRFNLRWSGRIPANIGHEEIVSALAEYVDFNSSEGLTNAPAHGTGDVSQVHKGMLRSEAERAFGAPVEMSDKREGGGVTTTLVFDLGEERVTAAFVEDVLIRYTISSK